MWIKGDWLPKKLISPPDKCKSAGWTVAAQLAPPSQSSCKKKNWLQGVPKKWLITGCPKKKWLIECCWSHGAHGQSPLAGTPWVWKLLFWSFLTKTSRIKRSQVMSMVKFSPKAFNFGYEFVLLVIFFRTPCSPLSVFNLAPISAVILMYLWICAEPSFYVCTPPCWTLNSLHV